jgi:hypothetical protein
VFALARKFLPLAEGKASEGELNMEELDIRFEKLKWLVLPFMIFIGVSFAFGTHWALVQINKAVATSDSGVEYYLLPQSAIWWFFPGFGALCFSWEITLQLWSLLGDPKLAGLYNRWSNLKTAQKGGRYAGMDSRKTLLWLGLLVALPIGVFTILALPMHASLDSGSIRDCGYGFRGCRVYPYSAATRMTAIKGFRIKDGSLKRRAGIVIDFPDGAHWSSAEWGDFKSSVDPVLADLLLKKTNLPLGNADTGDDIPR